MNPCKFRIEYNYLYKRLKYLLDILSLNKSEEIKNEFFKKYFTQFLQV